MRLFVAALIVTTILYYWDQNYKTARPLLGVEPIFFGGRKSRRTCAASHERHAETNDR
jgi:hypothetical protein